MQLYQGFFAKFIPDANYIHTAFVRTSTVSIDQIDLLVLLLH